MNVKPSPLLAKPDIDAWNLQLARDWYTGCLQWNALILSYYQDVRNRNIT
jgi:hypothetical protein